MERFKDIRFSISPSFGMALLAIFKKGQEPKIKVIKPQVPKVPYEVEHIIRNTPCHKTPRSGKR